MKELGIGSAVTVDLLDRCVSGTIECINMATPGTVWAQVEVKGHVQLFALEDFMWDSGTNSWRIKSFRGFYTADPLHYMTSRT